MVQINSRYTITPSRDYGADSLIILESRGGLKSGKTARNPDYSLQLTRILRMLKANQCTITRIEVLSTAALRTKAARKLKLQFPIKLSNIKSVEALRKNVQSAQRTVSQRQGASGGNSTKRIGIWVRSGPSVPAVGLKMLLGI